MPSRKGEVSKKHGDKLEPLIERTAGGSSREDEGRSPGEEEERDDDDPTLLQDDDDEDVENGDFDDSRDIDERD